MKAVKAFPMPPSAPSATLITSASPALLVFFPNLSLFSSLDTSGEAVPLTYSQSRPSNSFGQWHSHALSPCPKGEAELMPSLFLHVPPFWHFLRPSGHISCGIEQSCPSHPSSQEQKSSKKSSGMIAPQLSAGSFTDLRHSPCSPHSRRHSSSSEARTAAGREQEDKRIAATATSSARTIRWRKDRRVVISDLPWIGFVLEYVREAGRGKQCV
mmetsp:Transcript_25481/g.52120  ORF Transcript_25481/g.52120 Transcript_25481/m.52120 type:complete len:213 (+) Transcript_25481:356-994(+)